MKNMIERVIRENMRSGHKLLKPIQEDGDFRGIDRDALAIAFGLMNHLMGKRHDRPSALEIGLNIAIHRRGIDASNATVFRKILDEFGPARHTQVI